VAECARCCLQNMLHPLNSAATLPSAEATKDTCGGRGRAPSRPRSGPTCVPLLGLGPLRHMLVLERGFRLQHLRPEELTVPSRIRAGDHEDAIAAVVKRSRVIRRSRHMRLDHFEDE